MHVQSEYLSRFARQTIVVRCRIPLVILPRHQIQEVTSLGCPSLEGCSVHRYPNARNAPDTGSITEWHTLHCGSLGVGRMAELSASMGRSASANICVDDPNKFWSDAGFETNLLWGVDQRKAVVLRIPTVGWSSRTTG